MTYKSLKFGPDMKEFSKLKLDNRSTNYEFLLLLEDRLLQCKSSVKGGRLWFSEREFFKEKSEHT